jgi:tRNA(Ile)-lysidine synthase
MKMNLPDTVRNNLLACGASLDDPFLVAVSGGADSTALLLAMHAVLDRKGSITAAHLDHGVRADSAAEAGKVKDLCRGLGVDFIKDRLDASELDDARREYGSLEAGMRELRYRFLFSAAESSRSAWIVTGHTADDQSETVLFRVRRGMDWRSLGSIPCKRDRVLRPLIDVTRQATESYCKVMGVIPVTDMSNLDCTFMRGRIRNRILPALAEGFHPGVYGMLRRLARASVKLALTEKKLLCTLRAETKLHQEPILKSRDVKGLPVILQRGCVIDFLTRHLRAKPSRGLSDEVLGFMLAGRNGELSLPGGHILTLSYGEARITVGNSRAAREWTLEKRELTVPGTVFLPAAKVVIAAGSSSLQGPGSYPKGDTVLISKKCFSGSLWVRTRHPGDLFMPIGMGKEKKLKNVFIDRKVPRDKRDQIPLVLNERGDILWVAGIDISQKAALEGIEGEDAVILSLSSGTTQGAAGV